MNFTREPIIETVVTPKEGSKLLVRNSKAAGQEEYLVDAIEIVSFGKAFFFRSLESPKSFLVPVSDYELLEMKEARMVLKGVGFEKTIKIGGGKEARKEPIEPATPIPVEGEVEAAPVPSQPPSQESNKREHRKRIRRNKRHRDDRTFSPPVAQSPEVVFPEGEQSEGEKKEAEPIAVVRKLIPPPSGLIKEKLSRFKESLEAELLSSSEAVIPEPEVKKEEKSEEKKEAEEFFPPFSQDDLE